MPDAAPTTPAAPAPNASPWADSEGAPEPGAQASNRVDNADKDWEAAKAKALGKEPAPPAKAPANGKAKKAPEPEKTAAPPETETPAEPAKEKPPTSREWAVLNHKREKLAKDEAAFKTRYEQGQKEMSALESRTKEIETREKALEALESDPRAMIEHYVKKLGWSRGKVVNAINELLLDETKDPTALELAKMKQDLKRRDDEAEAKRKADEEAAKEAAKAADRSAQHGKAEGYQRTIATFVTEHADDYVHLPDFRAVDVATTAWGRIKSHYDKTGESLPLDEVLATLEAEEEQKFVAREERRRRRLSGDNTQNPEHGGAEKTAGREAQQRPATLNHGLATQRGQPARQLSDREAWEEAKKRAGV